MDFDVWLPTANPFCTPEFLAVVAREAEARAVHAIWVGEHVVTFEHYASKYPYAENGQAPIPPGSGLLEPFTTLAFLAGMTTTVRLGTAMCLLPQRNPVYTAKEVATVDWLSGGRVDLGVGVGWLREEFEAVAVPWERRGDRTDEYLQVLQTLWCEDPSSYSGRYYTLPPCNLHPKPVQNPHPPIHIGGESEAAMRRTARVGQGWHTFNRAPSDVPDALTHLEDLLGEQGRTRGDITVTVCPYFKPLDASITEQYAEAGADAVSALLFAMSADDVPAAFEALDPVIERARAC
jgi:probable F420-dependent oxidoreductase